MRNSISPNADRPVYLATSDVSPYCRSRSSSSSNTSQSKKSRKIASGVVPLPRSSLFHPLQDPPQASYRRECRTTECTRSSSWRSPLHLSSSFIQLSALRIVLARKLTLRCVQPSPSAICFCVLFPRISSNGSRSPRQIFPCSALWQQCRLPPPHA